MVEGKLVTAIVVAAGRSGRMGFDKLFYRIEGTEVLRRSVMAMDAHPAVDSLVVVAGGNIGQVRALFCAHPTQKPLDIVPGGETRADSVAAGVARAGNADFIAIHDGARPFVSADIITRTLHAAAKTGAAAPALPVKDTVKQIQGQGAPEGEMVVKTIARAALRSVQTPQIFNRAAYAQALAALPPNRRAAVTDDCMVMELAGHPVALVPGEEANRKITTPADLPPPQSPAPQAAPPALRIGHGYDVHRLVENRPLIVGGVSIPHALGLLGHSDADVLLHAVTDALLGAAALGDIGSHFPDTAAAYKNADSLVLLGKAMALVRQNGWRVGNIDATILCQRPKLAPHIPAMQRNIAGALGVSAAAVSIKATTEEGLGFTGSGQGVAAHCVALLQK